jgi:hypothetical protein
MPIKAAMEWLLFINLMMIWILLIKTSPFITEESLNLLILNHLIIHFWGNKIAPKFGLDAAAWGLYILPCGDMMGIDLSLIPIHVNY